MTDFNELSRIQREQWLAGIQNNRTPGIIVHSLNGVPAVTTFDPLWNLLEQANDIDLTQMLLQDNRTIQRNLLFIAQRLKKGQIDKYFAASEIEMIAMDMITANYEDDPRAQ